MVEPSPSSLADWLAALREALTAAASGLDPALVVGAAVVLPVALLWIALGLRRASEAHKREALAAAEFAEIKGRLTAMSEMTVRRQSEEARALDERVEQVAARLGSALDGVSRRLSDSLAETQRQNGDTVARLSERVDTLSRHMAQSLDTVSARLGDNLAEAGRRTTETLSTLNERLAVIAEAKQSLADLSSEVGSLSGVLANKQARGAFGQLRMETIIRDALPAGVYEFQATLSNGKRPDCVIRLPNTPAALVIDSKFPLEGFEALRVARAPDEVKAARDAIREAVGRHIDDIAEKYLIPGETQDTALMFVPSESVYGDLHEHFADLVQRAHRARVVIVAPNILMLAVQTVQAVIKDAKMRDQAGLIQREVGLLLADVSRLVERVSELERHFSLSGKALEKVSASASRISGRGERLVSLDLEDKALEGEAATSSAAQLTQRAS
ncbi:MAG: DNA recombination protein RmuC [Hyphomicrobium zavarzinii]|uniref:DNA recombination protein RmuC n=1 Tax=Hyphomicrobium zavarzinii TaxID=48292 RepID=UPI001A51E4CC|nr:DNA recombination protein RmuC [Hyphomicrobium zavarzinii]MBL8844275.1 DNA recombination protein RmuC [Hyphomicrobium zavarzinii]